MPKPKVIALCNQKGGVTKTTTTVQSDGLDIYTADPHCCPCSQTEIGTVHEETDLAKSLLRLYKIQISDFTWNVLQ